MFRPPPFCLCPLPPVLSLGTTEKSRAPSSLQPHFRNLYTWMRFPWAFSPGRTVPALSLSSPERCSSPLNMSVALHWSLQHLHLPRLPWGAQKWTQHCRCARRHKSSLSKALTRVFGCVDTSFLNTETSFSSPSCSDVTLGWTMSKNEAFGDEKKGTRTCNSRTRPCSALQSVTMHHPQALKTGLKQARTQQQL